MIVLKPTADPQTFKFIPRNYSTDLDFSFRDDTTNESIVYTPTTIKVGDYLQVTGVFNLVEGHFYDIRQDALYIDLAFCTAQEIDQTLDKEYNINKDVYITENTRNNDYVVL